MTQQDNASPSIPVSSVPSPAVTSKPVLPPPSSGFLPPPPASAQFIVRTSSTSLTPQPSLNFDDDDDDDDWDDFQAHEANEESPADISQQPIEEQTQRETDEAQASFSHPSTSTDHVDEDEETTHAGSDLPSPHDTPAQETGTDTGDHISSADSLVDPSNRTVDKEGSLNNEASVSPSASREAETLQEEDEDDMWDSFESAPVALSDREEASSNPQHTHDDDDIWDSSPKSLKDVEQPELLDGSSISERPVEESAEPNEDLESSVPNAEVSPGHVSDVVERDIGGGSVDDSADLKTNVDGPAVNAEASPGDVGTDAVEGDVGADAVEGDVGTDAVEGDVGADAVEGDVGTDAVEGDVGADAVEGDVGADAVEGDVGADAVEGDVGADAVEGDDGDVFEEAVEEIDTNPSAHGENDPAEAQEVPSESDLHKQIIDHSGLIALAGAEAEEKMPLEIDTKENGHVAEVANSSLDVQNDVLDDSVEMERLAPLAVAHSFTPV
jgi:hypothetical protein